MNDFDEFDSNSKKAEGKRMLSNSYSGEEYSPIQKNASLFKFILYTSKIELKSNGLINLIYITSIVEIGIWFVGLLLFISSPSTLYLNWVLIVHLFKGFFGLVLLNSMPKTYEILENLSKRPDLEEDKIPELIQQEVKDTFMTRWTENKNKLLVYFILNILALVTDLVIFIVELVLFGKLTYFLMEFTLLCLVLIYICIYIQLIIIGCDVVYFLWLFTINFSFPSYMTVPIRHAIIGSIKELKDMAFAFLRRKPNPEI